MIDKTRYTLNDKNGLVNEIAKKKIGNNNAIKVYNNLVDKAEQISKLRSWWKINGLTGEESVSRIKGLTILTPNQILSTLPIYLAQLKAGNNCEKLKNEIRQKILKNLKKQLYKSLFDII